LFKHCGFSVIFGLLQEREQGFEYGRHVYNVKVSKVHDELKEHFCIGGQDYIEEGQVCHNL
jgi:hypothetical protein